MLKPKLHIDNDGKVVPLPDYEDVQIATAIYYFIYWVTRRAI